MQVERVNRVVGIEFFAVRELYALAKAEGPLGCTRLGFPALGELWNWLIVRAVFDELVINTKAHEEANRIGPAAWIHAVGGAAAAKAELQCAALFRRIRCESWKRDG